MSSSTVPIKIHSSPTSAASSSAHHLHHHNHHHLSTDANHHHHPHGSHSGASSSSSSSTSGSCNQHQHQHQHRVIRLKKLGRDVPLGFSIRGGWEHGTGIFVSEVHPGSEAERQGLQAGDQLIRVNGFSVDQASHDHVISLIKSSSKITLKVKSIGSMVPIKGRGDVNAKDTLSWQLIKTQAKDAAAASTTIPILSTFQPHKQNSSKLALSSGKLLPSSSSSSGHCPVHMKSRYASSTGGSSRSITSSSHESDASSDSDGNNYGKDRHYRHQKDTKVNCQDVENEKLIKKLIKSEKIIEEKVNIQLKINQNLGCSVVRGPSSYPGIFVQNVKSGGAAADAKLEIGDQIIGMNGFNFFPGHFDFQDAISKLKSAKQMTLTIRKGIAINLFNLINSQQEQREQQSKTTTQQVSRSRCNHQCSTSCHSDHHQQQPLSSSSAPDESGKGQQQQQRNNNINGTSSHKIVHKIKAIVHNNGNDGISESFPLMIDDDDHNNHGNGVNGNSDQSCNGQALYLAPDDQQKIIMTCKLHPHRKQTEVKQLYKPTINDTNEVINLESSVDLDTSLDELSVLERVRLEKEQIALERKRLEEESNSIRLQMEQLAIERKRLEIIKETSSLKSDNESIHSNSTTRTLTTDTNGHVKLSATSSSVSSSSSSSASVSASSGMGFLDELKKLAEKRINPDGLLTDTLNKTNFNHHRDKPRLGRSLFPTENDEKRKRHELLMEEFKSAHSKMFGAKSSSDETTCLDAGQQMLLERRQLASFRENEEDANESCSSSTTSSSGVSSSSVSTFSSSTSGAIKKVVMFSDNQQSNHNQVIKSNLKRSTPITKETPIQRPEKVTVLKSSKKFPAPPPPPPPLPSLDESSVDTNSEIFEQFQSNQTNLRGSFNNNNDDMSHNKQSPLVTITSYSSSDRISKTSGANYVNNKNQVKPVSIRINCKLPDEHDE